MHFFYYAENKTQLIICLIFDYLNHLRTDKFSYKYVSYNMQCIDVNIEAMLVFANLDMF